GFEIVGDENKPENLNPTDKWILAELDDTSKKCIDGYDELNFFIPSNTIREFTWNIFAAHYIELIKSRVYNENKNEERKSALYTIHKCFKSILMLLEPICPFITYELWTKIYNNKKIINQKEFPEISNDFQDMLSFTQKIIKFNSEIWNRKKETISNITNKPLSLKDSIEIGIPDELELFKCDLIAMHNIIEENKK
ncbi:MAG: class I tRNA ligase family protein, partial [Thermoproteota archaeon]|nr:class I tRNA ligase family protein [Thermoproteota archaeon]